MAGGRDLAGYREDALSAHEYRGTEEWLPQNSILNLKVERSSEYIAIRPHT
jgi:hypothetical protein